MLLTFSKEKFYSDIMAGRKIHTIRTDKNRRWKKGNKIHFWLGNPRNTNRKPPPKQFKLAQCKSVEQIIIRKEQDIKLYPHGMSIKIMGQALINKEIELLAFNDGLEINEFREWFLPGMQVEYKGRIIHWTDYKYIDQSRAAIFERAKALGRPDYVAAVVNQQIKALKNQFYGLGEMELIEEPPKQKKMGDKKIEIRKQLIERFLENWSGLSELSITNYAETGKVSGSLFIAINAIMKEYEKEFTKGTKSQNWISVKKDLPTPEKMVLCLCPEQPINTYVVASYDPEYGFVDNDDYAYNPSHWQPLPTPPNQL